MTTPMFVLPIDGGGYLVLYMGLHLLCVVTYAAWAITAVVQFYCGLWVDEHGQRRLFRRGFGR